MYDTAKPFCKFIYAPRGVNIYLYITYISFCRLPIANLPIQKSIKVIINVSVLYVSLAKRQTGYRMN